MEICFDGEWPRGDAQRPKRLRRAKISSRAAHRFFF